MKPLQNSSLDNSSLDISQLIVISPLRRAYSPELVFGISYLDKNIDVMNYKYYWTVDHFNEDKQYINGRKEIKLKVLNEELLTGVNNIIIKVIDDINEKEFSKKYLYEKHRAPYGGYCQVSPRTGISMKTNFKFSISNWITKSEPMIYDIKYLNKDKIYFSISKTAFIQKFWTTDMIPVADNFFVEVTDSSGLSSLAPCSVEIKPNNELKDIDFYTEKEFDPINKLLIIDIYKSNIENLEKFKKNSKDDSLNNKALDMMKTYMENLDNIQQDLEKIIAIVLNISNQSFNKDKLFILNKAVLIIIENIDSLLQNIDKVRNVYYILDNLYKKVYSREDFKHNKGLLNELQNYLKKLNLKLFGSIESGQSLLIVNENYDIQMNKISKLNVKTIDFGYDYISDNDKLRSLKDSKNFKERRKNKKTKIRYLQLSNSNNCEDSFAAICIPSNNITSILGLDGSNNIGFQGELNHKDNLPISEKQYSNSLDFDLSIQEKNGHLRKLDFKKLKIRYEIRLKLPTSSKASDLHETTCVQYIDKKPDTSCESWYDAILNVVICSCKKQGLTVNVMEKSLSNLSKISQFPTINTDICNFFIIFFYQIIFII